MRGQTAAQRAAQHAAKVERDRKRAAIATVYRAYCKTTGAVTAKAANRRPVLLRLLKRLTRQTDEQKALLAGRRAAGIKRRSPTLPDGTLPAACGTGSRFHGRDPKRVYSVVVNNVGRGKRT